MNHHLLDLSEDPFLSLGEWIDAARVAVGDEEGTAMTLATAAVSGRPKSRIVLFKGFGASASGEKGLCFFTNYESRKSHDLAANPWASLTFFWFKLGRQIGVEGRVEKVSAAESDAYFASRPRGSRIGAWASPQSQKIANREELLKRVADVEAKFGGGDDAAVGSLPIPRPSNWGGWILVPDRIEFWQAAEFRLHDRMVYERQAVAWARSRLAP